MCFPAGAFPPHVIKAAERENIIAILIVICCIVGICHDENIIIGIISANRIQADDNLPVAAPIHPVHHDRRTLVQVLQKKRFKIVQGLKIRVGVRVRDSLPSDGIKKTGKYDSGGDLPFYRWHNDGKPDSIFVLKKGEYQEIEEKIVNTLDSGLMLLAKKDGETEYSIYNTIDGSILLKQAGTKVYGSDYWVYVLKNGVWEVYKVAASN